MKYYDIINTLINEAYKSECAYKHSALLIYNNKIVSIGHNRHLPYDKDYQKRWTVHAEVDCLIKLPRKLKSKCREMNMYTIRVDKSGHLAIATPCEKCNSFINKYNVKTVYHSI